MEVRSTEHGKERRNYLQLRVNIEYRGSPLQAPACSFVSCFISNNRKRLALAAHHGANAGSVDRCDRPSLLRLTTLPVARCPYFVSLSLSPGLPKPCQGVATTHFPCFACLTRICILVCLQPLHCHSSAVQGGPVSPSVRQTPLHYVRYMLDNKNEVLQGNIQ